MNIGQAADATGVSAKRIRYYEQIGLLGKTTRSESGYRVFDQEALHTLRFIRRARRLGFSVPKISALLELWQDQGRSSADVKRLVETHLDELREKIGDLQSMVDTLQHLADRCDGDARPDCPILHGLERSAT
ncbi:Cu(I)-responsive transcriptional regulator [Marinihelvus fidelis]|uniref:Cu(I)-responsive transcriptional regulator n=1 Tax=Marinihelvus fidelis TaxID=2613842 RepID=A0A5N0TFB1_9GAMM|nr:Cu(I)-responsive transcriptional regulator [Marinihelvus fidelis]KAA9133154.1 Cu(I)-responsive transcriptional regulator [Marinihelvus fidelis]